MVYNAATCAQRAEADHTNSPGYCLQQTRDWCGITALYGDAATAWRNTNDRHPNNRQPPRGAPVYWTGGSHGYGHIALSLGGGRIRSTDAGGRGVVATVDLGWVETHWGLTYAGWAWDINETTIPHGDKDEYHHWPAADQERFVAAIVDGFMKRDLYPGNDDKELPFRNAVLQTWRNTGGGAT